MKLIVGLGNPGKAYKDSRHNLGFSVVDRLAHQWGCEVRQRKFQGTFGQTVFGGESVILLKPQTYMNRSGESVSAAAGFYRIDRSDILVVLDDMALGVGELRLRGQGSAGGHNGLSDVLEKLGGDDVARCRIGIGAAPYGDAVDHVLGKIDASEQALLDGAVGRAADAAACWLESGIDEAMNRYNTKRQPPSADEER